MHIQIDDYTASFLANKLLRFITAIKSLAQAGSNFNKNCLLTIGNIMLLIDEVSGPDMYYTNIATTLNLTNIFLKFPAETRQKAYTSTIRIMWPC